MDFRQAFQTAAAELTPQPWEYTSDHGTTLTVVPAGLTADQGDAEVDVRITFDKHAAAEIGVTTAALPGLIDAIEKRTEWTHTSLVGDCIDVSPVGNRLRLRITTPQTKTQLTVPSAQQLPLASALRRALDVAHGWER